MSRLEYADPQAPAPSFGVPEATDPNRNEPRALRAVRIATIPFVISIAAHFVFFLAFWVPETSRFPQQAWWLNQLAPLSSQYVISGGMPLAELQEGGAGVTATLLLIFSLLILWMARSGYWVARTWIWAPVLAGAAVCVVTIALLAANHQLALAWVSVVLMICWVVAAGWAAWLSMLVDIDSLPRKGHRSGLAILIAYVLLGAPPTAVGRLLFAPELREVAEELQQNTVALRTAALALPTNLWIYLSGVLAGVVLWLAYQLVPPRRDRRTVTLAAALVASLITLLAFGGLVTQPAASKQTERLRTESPIDRLRLTCGKWIADPAAPVQQTVAIDQPDCNRLTTYAGYIQREMQILPEDFSSLNLRTPEGEPIRGKFVAARYDTVLVVASGGVEDHRATTVRGLLLSDGIQVWQWRCPTKTDLTLRFAGVPGGDDGSRGYITLAGETSAVVVGCPSTLKRLDPRTGLGKS
jgi:hypothetical protein